MTLHPLRTLFCFYDAFMATDSHLLGVDELQGSICPLWQAWQWTSCTSIARWSSASLWPESYTSRDTRLGEKCRWRLFVMLQFEGWWVGVRIADLGSVDFESFSKILNRPGGFRDPGQPEEYCRGFQVFDKDMTGFIGVGQLRYSMFSRPIQVENSA